MGAGLRRRGLAILDRLLHHCDVVPINGPSYRLKNRLTAIENVA
jgi:DNA replication protein DnaC